MIVRVPSSGSPLSKLVEVFWYFDTLAEPGRDVQPGAREKVLPTGTFEFVFNLAENRIYIHELSNKEQALSGAITCGAHSQYFMLGGERRGRVAGVHFRPGGVYPLLRRSAADFANRHVDLVSIFGPSVTAFRRELTRLATPDATFAALEKFLAEKIDQRRAIAPAVARALNMLEQDPFCNPVPSLQSAFGLTQKALIEAFKREVGLTPKRYSRLMRFQAVLKRINGGENIDWADTALRCGYYDQAHFCRDFRAFSGLSPGEYRSRAGSNPNHVSV